MGTFWSKKKHKNVKTTEIDNNNEYRLEDFYLSEKNQKNKDRFDSFESENDIENLKNNLLKTDNRNENKTLNESKDIKTIKREDIENEIISQDLDDTDDIFLEHTKNDFNDSPEIKQINELTPTKTQGIKTSIVNLKSELFDIENEEDIPIKQIAVNEETKNKISDLKEKLKNVSEEISSTNNSIEIVVSDIQNDLNAKEINDDEENAELDHEKSDEKNIPEDEKINDVDVVSNIENEVERNEVEISEQINESKIENNVSVNNDIDNEIEEKDVKENSDINISDVNNEVEEEDVKENSDINISDVNNEVEKKQTEKDYFAQIENELKNLTTFIDDARADLAKTLNIATNKEDESNEKKEINEDKNLNEEKKKLELRIRELELELEKQKFSNNLARQEKLQIKNIKDESNDTELSEKIKEETNTNEIRNFQEKILEEINNEIINNQQINDKNNSIQLAENNEKEKILSEKIELLQNELSDIKSFIYQNKSNENNKENVKPNIENDTVSEMLEKSKQIGEELDRMITKVIEENNEIESYKSEIVKEKNNNSSLTKSIYEMRETLRNREIGNEFDEQYEIYQREKKLNEAKEIYLNELKKRNRLLTEEIFLQDIQKNRESYPQYTINEINTTNPYLTHEIRNTRLQQQPQVNFVPPGYMHNSYTRNYNNIFDANNFPYQKTSVIPMPSGRFNNKTPTLKINPAPQTHIPSPFENKRPVPEFQREASLIFNDDLGELKRKDMISAYVKELMKSKKKY